MPRRLTTAWAHGNSSGTVNTTDLTQRVNTVVHSEPVARMDRFQDSAIPVSGIPAARASNGAATVELNGREDETHRVAQLAYLQGRLEQFEGELHGAEGSPLSPLGKLVQRLRAWRSAPLLREAIELVAIVLVLFLASRPLVQAFRVEGVSMLPTLQDGQLVVVDKLSYWRLTGFVRNLFGVPELGTPTRGEIVVFLDPASTQPGAPERNLVKRLIGLPGDRIRIDNGAVLVNDRVLAEPYLQLADSTMFPGDGRTLEVPAGSYFVLGDNRPHSSDSRGGWFLPADDLIGQAWLSYWPPSTWGFVVQPRGSGVVDSDGRAAAPSSSSAVSNPAQQAPPVVPSAAPQPTLIPAPNVTARSGGWPDDPDSTMWLAEGGYVLAPREPGRFVAVGAPLGELPSNTVLRATFRKVGGPPGGGYGLILRDEGPGPRDGVGQGGRYYVLEVGDQADVGIWRREVDHWVDLVPWRYSDAVNPGPERNELEARADGSRLTLRVNNVEVASVNDTTLSGGGAGVFVGGDGNDVLLEQFAVDLVR